MAAQVKKDRCGRSSGLLARVAAGFDLVVVGIAHEGAVIVGVVLGPETGAPILDQAVAWIACEVRQAVDCGGHTLFVGEVVDCAFAQAEDTPVLRMEDTRMSYGG